MKIFKNYSLANLQILSGSYQKPIPVFYKTTKPNKILNCPDKRGGRWERPPRYAWLSKYYLVVSILFFRNLAFDTLPQYGCIQIYIWQSFRRNIYRTTPLLLKISLYTQPQRCRSLSWKRTVIHCLGIKVAAYGRLQHHAPIFR